MLFFSRWKSAAIVLTALIVCLAAVPNFFLERTVLTWPKWMQSRVVLGLDLQGGSHILLQVDIADVRRQKVEALRDDVRRVLRDARLANTNTVRGDTVERSEEHTSELQSRFDLVCRLLLEKKNH